MLASALKKLIAFDKEKKTLDKILTPKNCECLVVPKTNSEIWAMMPKMVKERDLQWQRIQHLVVKALTPVVVVMDILGQREDQQCLKPIGDAFRVLVMMISNISLKRKENISQELAPHFRQLCSPQHPVTTLLFGDELHRELREIQESQNIGFKIGNHGRGRGQGRGTANRGRWNDYGGQQAAGRGPGAAS